LISKQEQQQENKFFAETLLSQIGKKTLFLINAQHFLYDKNYLQFKVQSWHKNINTIIIRLNQMDYYDIEFRYCKVTDKEPYIIDKLVKTEKDISCDMLSDVLSFELVYK
jgi:hypothetical protein